MRGLESNLPTPFDSAAVMKKSTAKFGERWVKPKPLVGADAPRLTLKGIPVEMPLPVAEPLPIVTGEAGMPGLVVTPLPPTAGEPLYSERPPVVLPAKP